MAAPALNRRAGSVSSIGSSPTATPNSTNNNRVIPCYPELDFRSGTRIEELNRLIQEFSKHDQREYDDQRALEIHTAKDFIFSMLGKERLGQAMLLVLIKVCFSKQHDIVIKNNAWKYEILRFFSAYHPVRYCFDFWYLRCIGLAVCWMRVLIFTVGFSEMLQKPLPRYQIPCT